MKNLLISLIVVISLVLVTCNDEEFSDRFKFLTGSVWVSDSLLADGVEAGGVGEILEDFKGELKFNKNGTGVFGVYKGTWELTQEDTEIILTTDSLAFPILTQIAELTENSLKVTTGFPNPLIAGTFLKIRMTFKSK